ncbi:MAG TPA: tRNA 4-thiouridine(8) synthase ThiI [Firmicutes bacterium]|nr:tRNA 4-thiouridine(8) synthase ThiI [Bacillota bacterium]
MKYDLILIRYGELTTKGKNRKKFITFLRENISVKLKKFSHLKYESTRDRMYIFLNGENQTDVMNALEEVFGIHKFDLAVRTVTDLQSMKEHVLEAAKEALKNGKKTFKISVHRAYKEFPLDTFALQQQLGAHVLIQLDGALQVDVKNPNVNIKVEVRPDFTYVMCQQRNGLGGYPVGVGGKSLLLLSGGIDSPVAAYLMMKRGVNVECIHFHSPPFTSERAKEKVIDLVKILTKYNRQMKLHLVPFTEIQKAIHKEIPANYTMTIMRRMMLRIATEFARKRKALVLSTGESLGQVASQTVDSMYVINEVTDLPVLRPVIAMDKLEIIDLSIKIGTYETSIRPYEDCCTIFLSDHPTTRPKREKCAWFESKFDFKPLLHQAVQGIETLTFKQNESTNVNGLDNLL